MFNRLSRYLYGFAVALSLIVSITACKQKKHSENTEPPVAHFVYGLWDTTSLEGTYFERTMQLWAKGGWRIKLWNKQDVEGLLDLPGYEKYKKVYHSLPRNIQKADFARYLIVLHEGGFYFDLDCLTQYHEPKHQANLATLKEMHQHKDIFFLEFVHTPQDAAATADIPIRKGIPETAGDRIANFAFAASKKNSPALVTILDLLCERCELNPHIISDYDVLYTTGPDLITEALHRLDPRSYYLIRNTHEYIFHCCASTWRDSNDVAGSI